MTQTYFFDEPAASPPPLRGAGASYMVKVQTLKVSEPLCTLDCRKPEQAHLYWHTAIATQPWFDESKEHLVVVTLNTRLRITNFSLISIGTMDQSLAHPREILRPIIVLGSYAFLLMHNHPSGDPSPSHADHAMTRRITEVAQLVDIKLLDHVIIGSRTEACAETNQRPYFSFQQGGVL